MLRHSIFFLKGIELFGRFSSKGHNFCVFLLTVSARQATEKGSNPKGKWEHFCPFKEDHLSEEKRNTFDSVSPLSVSIPLRFCPI